MRKVAIEAIRGIKTGNELAKEFSVRPTWRGKFPEGAEDAFKKGKSKTAEGVPRNRLYRESRVFDNLFAEQFRRSAKYKLVYPTDRLN